MTNFNRLQKIYLLYLSYIEQLIPTNNNLDLLNKVIYQQWFATTEKTS